MKNIVYIILFLFSLPIYSQKKVETTAIDSILSLIDDKNLTIKEKFALGDKAAGLPYTEYTKVLKKLIHYGKQEKDKSSLINTYCTLSNVTNLHEKDIEKGKAYLDSAYLYIYASMDNNINANLCCLIGNYFFSKRDEPRSFDFYRKGLEYCAKSEGTEITKLKILYRICAFYNLKADKISLKKYMDEMLLTVNSNKSNEAYFITFPICAAYYRTSCNSAESESKEYYQFLDSVHHYDKKIVDIYESENSTFKKNWAATMAKYYLNYAESTIIRKSSDWKIAIQAVDKSTDILLPTDTMALIRNIHVKSRIFFNIKEYDQAVDEGLKSLDILKNYTGEKYSGYYDTYSVLVDSYVAQKDYENALQYERLRSDIIKKMNEIDKYETVKDIETKYETAEKELEISHLNEEKQETRFKISLMLSVGILSILCLFFAFLYNRMKRLRKEKEAILLTAKINEKELENQSILKESELKQMRHYLDGLEVERNRLSKDLHDVVANKLYILDQNLQGIYNIPESIFNQIEDLYTQTRNISHDLISPSFQYTTLPEILFNFIEETKESTSLQFHLNISPENYFDSLSMPVSHEIYRIVQESIGNIIKHASARNAWIYLSYSDNMICLEVKDDGEGFDIQKQTKGIGLQIIENRCNSLNGKLIINSEIGNGCSVKVTIPTTLPIADELQ